MLETFDLNLLRALDVLLRERNVTRAAEQLHVTQQAMSGSLRRLREHFDDELLLRVGRQLELTPCAAALMEPVHEVMLQIGRAVQTRPTFDPATEQRRFRIAMSDYATVTILPPLMTMLTQQAPGLVLDVQLIDGFVFRDLEQGALDFCLLPSNWQLYQNSQPRGIRSTNLYRDDFVCVVDVGNPVVKQGLGREQYLQMPHTMLRLGADVKSIVEGAWIAQGIAPPVAATATSFASLVFMIPGTPLIATVQRRLATQFARMLQIAVLECPIRIDALEADLSWHIRNGGDPAHQYMRDLFNLAGERIAYHK